MKLDPRLVFYLKHRQQIDEWAELKKLLPEVVDEFFRSLSNPVREMAAAQDDAPDDVYVSFEEHCPKIFLVRKTWSARRGSPPLLGIGLEWSRGNREFDASYTGIWVNQEMPEGVELRALLADAIKTAPGAEDYKSSKWWAAWKYEQPFGDDFWDDLDDFQAQLVRAVEASWRLFSTVVDGVMEEAGLSGPGGKA